MYERSIIAKLQSTKYKGALRHSDKCKNEICQSEMWILSVMAVAFVGICSIISVGLKLMKRLIRPLK